MSRILFTILTFFATTSFGQINLVIDDLEIPRINIVVQGCNGNEYKDSNLILANIRDNLDSTNLFNIKNWQDDEIYKIEDEIEGGDIILYDKYSEDGVDALIYCDQSVNFKDNTEIRFTLWDILDEKEIFSKINILEDNHQKIANFVSDEIFKAMTKEKSGHFNSKITYVAESGDVLNRKKRIATINFDGSNLRYLTNGRNLALTPKFSNDPDKLTIVLYRNNRPSLFNLDIQKRRLSKLTDFQGTTMSADINPKNPDLVVFAAIDKYGNSDIYILDNLTGIRKRLTFAYSIEATPSFSPDGKKIIFTSDRSGMQQIYQMNLRGKNIKRITSDRGDYSKPVWSPDGSLIAFTKIVKGKFTIGIMTSYGYNERILTSGYVVEGVSWSPNGRYLIYSRKDGAYGQSSIPSLYIIDVVTGFERRFSTPSSEGATDPDWITLD